MSKAGAVTLQTQVQKVIDELVESGTERGLQVAVYKRGEQVVGPVARLWPAITKNRLTQDFNAATEVARLVTTFEE
jgi:hypothetical protein